jgi:predicted O-methyltransferase YrrM
LVSSVPSGAEYRTFNIQESIAAKNNKLRGDAIEIGSWKGKSTVCLALGIKENGSGKVYAIDHHRGSKEHGTVNTYEEFKKNIFSFGVSDYVIPLVMSSEEANKSWQRPIKLLWIDGSHEYEDVKKDFLIWQEYLVEGGLIAFHDTFFWPGPKKVVDEYIFGGEFKNIGFVDDITFATKARSLTQSQKEKNKRKKIVRDAIFPRRRFTLRRLIERLSKILKGS